MKANIPFIFESNFTKMSEGILNPLIEKHGYRALTVLFDADTDILYKRFIDRERLPERHNGLKSGRIAEHDVFANGAHEARRFGIGETIRVDTADFEVVSYDNIVKRISKFIERAEAH